MKRPWACPQDDCKVPSPLVGEGQGEGERESSSTAITPIPTFPRQGGRDSWIDFAILLSLPLRRRSLHEGNTWPDYAEMRSLAMASALRSPWDSK